MSNPIHPLAQAVARPDWPARLRGALALALVLVFAFYGFLAIQEALVTRHFMAADNHAAMLALQQAADAGTDVRASGQLAAAGMPLWMDLMAAATRDSYSYGADSLFQTAVYYTQMPVLNKVVLSFHMFLGGLCMVLGGSQFWPAFRRRFPRIHRAFGMVFVVTAQAAMVLSMTYLLRTDPADTYGQLVFHVGLWVLAVGVTLSLWMAMWHVWKRQFAQHQAWMGLAYGFLLTAPLLRYDWILLGMLFPGASMNEANYAGMMLLIPQSFLFGYALVCLNRWRAAPRAGLQPLPLGDAVRAALPRWWPLLAALCLALAALTLHYYVFTPGMAGAPWAQALVPRGVILNELRVYTAQPVVTALFALLVAGVLGLAPFFIRQAFRHPQGTADLLPLLRRQALWLAGLGAAASGLALVLAADIGAPSHATLSGGTLYALTGLAGLAFSLLLAQAAWRQRLALVKEWGLFTVLTLASAPLFYVVLAALGAIGLPPQYIATGHAYLLAAGFVPGFLLFGFIYAIYGSASRERVAY